MGKVTITIESPNTPTTSLRGIIKDLLDPWEIAEKAGVDEDEVSVDIISSVIPNDVG